MSGRLRELDSLRGLAALSVVAYHYALVLPQTYAAILAIYDPSVSQPRVGLYWLVFSPLHLFWSGTEAVTLFFVLSGFVLALPFFSRPVGYLSFLVNRVCRIYPAYLVAVVLAMAGAGLLTGRRLDGLSPWFATVWSTPVSWTLAIQHLLLIDNFKNGVFDPVIWSLVYEMRISLVFPLLMLAVRALDWRWLVPGVWLLAIGSTYLPLGPTMITMEYIPMFVTGALLAKHRHALTAWIRATPPSVAVALAVLAVLAYTYPWAIVPHSAAAHPQVGMTHGRLLNDFFVSLGAGLFILLALGRPRVRRTLLVGPLPWLGKVSYSIYLLHPVALFALLYLGYPRLPLLVIWPAAIALTIGAAGVSFAFVERPWISLGHRWAGRVSPSTAGPVQRAA